MIATMSQLRFGRRPPPVVAAAAAAMVLLVMMISGSTEGSPNRKMSNGGLVRFFPPIIPTDPMPPPPRTPLATACGQIRHLRMRSTSRAAWRHLKLHEAVLEALPVVLAAGSN
jgi:hypothetical protein